MNAFVCVEENCGRKFLSQKNLEEHQFRRHKIAKESSPQSFPLINQKKIFFQNQKIFRPYQLERIPKLMGQQRKLSNPIIKLKNHEERKVQTVSTQQKQLDTAKTEEEVQLDNQENKKDSNQADILDILDQEFPELKEENGFQEQNFPLKQFTSNEIIQAKQNLTEDYIKLKSGYDQLEDIQQLILRGENLIIFEETGSFPIDNMIRLQFLSLSHNQIFNLFGVSRLTNLIELNINYNQIEELFPLKECFNLKKLFASHNHILNIKCLEELSDLEVLSLYSNNIKDLEESLNTFTQLSKLKELDFDKNPCTRRFSYKFDILWKIKLEKLDGEIINEVDIELAKSFRKEVVQRENEFGFSYQQSDQQSLSRPNTAPGRMKPQDFGSNQNSYSDRFKQKLKQGGILSTQKYVVLNNESIPEANEKIYELEQELENSNNQKNDLQQQLNQLNEEH